MILAMKTNTDIRHYENCTFGELQNYIRTFNRIAEKRNER